MSAAQMLMAAAGAGGSSNVYPTWNPNDKSSNVTLSNGNLTATNSGSTGLVRANLGKTSGKWYWEITVGSITSGSRIGIATSNALTSTGVGMGSSDYASIGWANTGTTYSNSSSVGLVTFTYTTGDIVGFALNVDLGTVTLYKNGTLIGTLTYTSYMNGVVYPAVGYTSEAVTANFGASAFAYTPPAGYNSGFFYTQGTDPYWLNTTLLMQFEGSNGGTVMTDAKGHAFTAQSGATTSTTTPLLGTASLLNTASSWIDTPGSTFINDITAFSGDFTIEGIFKTSATGLKVLFGQLNSGGTLGSLYLNIGSGGYSLYNGSTSILSGATSYADGNPHSFALVRFGTVIYLFVDGSLATSATYASSIANYSSAHFAIGRAGDYAAANFVGEIDEFRITNGVGRYLGSYVPQTVNSPLLGGPFGFATWNPSDLGSNNTLSNGNLTLTTPANGNPGQARANMGKSTGRWYWETTMNAVASSMIVGFGTAACVINSGYFDGSTGGWGYQSNQYVIANSATIAGPVGGAWANGDVIGTALDLWAGTVYQYRNGTLTGVYSILTYFPAGTVVYPIISTSATLGGQSTTNFGATAFAYTPPTGFIGLQG